MAFSDLLGFPRILRESIKTIGKNYQAMATIIIASILLHFLLFCANILSTRSVLRNLVASETLLLLVGPRSPEMADLLIGIKKDARIILGVESAVLLFSFLVSLLSMGATVLASATACHDKCLYYKDLPASLAKSSIRQFTTLFYTSLFFTGYIVFVLSVVIPLFVMIDHPIALKSTAISIGTVAAIFWIYLSVVWVLALVISIIEPSCYGIEALGKAGGLIKGKRLHGFVLNFLFTVALTIIVQISRMIKRDNKSVLMEIIIGFLLIVFYCLVAMFQYISYTVLYFQCKKTRGEEIELQGSLEYSKVPFSPLINEDGP